MSTLASLGIGTIIAALITAGGSVLVATNSSSRIERLLATASATTDPAQRAIVMQEVNELKRKRQVQQRTRWGLVVSIFVTLEIFVLGIVDIESPDPVGIILFIVLIFVCIYFWNEWNKAVASEKTRAKKEIPG